MSVKTIKILDPTAPSRAAVAKMASRASGLGGSTLGIVSNLWRSFDIMAAHFEELAKDRYQVREVMRTINPNLANPILEDTLNALVAKSDAAIVGMGH